MTKNLPTKWDEREKDGNYTYEMLDKTQQKKLADNEEVIEKFRKSGLEAGKALRVIRDERLYRQTHKTFEEYLKERWDIERTYGHYLITYAETVENVHNCEQIPETESQARPLTKLEPEKQKKVWQKVVDWSKKTGKQITAKVVEEVVKEETKGLPTKKTTNVSVNPPATLGSIHVEVPLENLTEAGWIKSVLRKGKILALFIKELSTVLAKTKKALKFDTVLIDVKIEVNYDKDISNIKLGGGDKK